MRHGFRSLKKKFLHSCINIFISIRKKNETRSQTTEQADNPPLRYVTVMTHSCIVFVLFVLLKR